MIVNIVTAFESYGSEFQENIYKSDGSKTLTGMDFNDLEKLVKDEPQQEKKQWDKPYNKDFKKKPSAIIL